MKNMNKHKKKKSIKNIIDVFLSLFLLRIIIKFINIIKILFILLNFYFHFNSFISINFLYLKVFC